MHGMMVLPVILYIEYLPLIRYMRVVRNYYFSREYRVLSKEYGGIA